MSKHKHKFKLSSYSKTEAHFFCKCGERRVRSLTKKEQRFVNKSLKETINPKIEDNVHYVWYKFAKSFAKNMSSIPEEWDTEKLFSQAHKWAEKYPEHIRIIRCDDSVHAGSDLILIEHKSKNKYMGTTVLYVPQCTGEKPTRFFLYPDHNRELIRSLKEINKQRIPIQKRQRELEKQSEQNIEAIFEGVE